MGYEKIIFQFIILIPVALLFFFSDRVEAVFQQYDSLLKNAAFIAIVSGLMYFIWWLFLNFIRIKQSRIKIALAEAVSERPGLSTDDIISAAKKRVPLSFMFGGVFVETLDDLFSDGKVELREQRWYPVVEGSPTDTVSAPSAKTD